MSTNLSRAGKYHIDSEIGRGSMGVVYRAFDPDIRRQVAIKTMRTQGLSSIELEDYKARFKREASAVGQMSHPNIVTVYDFSVDGDLFFLAMEYLEGKSLRKIMETQGRLPIETVIHTCQQVCSALEHAHTRGVVHRDVKPENIMVLEDGTVKVTDFGVAKMLSAETTQPGQILGTPSYMSPEQVQCRPLDGRSDIFSLGVILYELVAGRRPFT